MNISIFGLGYVGCVTLGCLAQNGNTIIGIDINQDKIDLINNGMPTFIEKDIDKIIREAYEQEKITATHDYLRAVAESEISIITVGTPSTKEGHLNLEFIYKVAEEIGEALKFKDDFHIIAIRSTVLPGTNKEIGEIIENISDKRTNKEFAVVSNPEFLREGSAVKDFYNPPFSVLGSDSIYALEKMEELYKDLNAPVIIVNAEIAEIIKFINNSFHALKISFANEVGNICKKLGVDSNQVMDLFVRDKKLNLSPYYLRPGFAYGGSCLPKDLKGLITIAHDHYLNSPVLESIDNSNENQKLLTIQMIEQRKSRKVGILGLSFKAGTDDLRYSPIVEIAEYLLEKGYGLSIYDKNVNISKLTGTNKKYMEKHIPHLSELISDNLLNVIENSEIIVITHEIDGVADHITKNPDKYFIDLARVTNEKFNNYEGICW